MFIFFRPSSPLIKTTSSVVSRNEAVWVQRWRQCHHRLTVAVALRPEGTAENPQIFSDMGRSLLFSSLKFPQIPTSILPFNPSIHPFSPASAPYSRRFHASHFPTKTLCAKAVLSESPKPRTYPKMGADAVGPIPPSQLIQVVELAANTGAQVWPIPISLCLVAEKTIES